MTNSQLVRVSGLVLLTGVATFILHIVARSVATAGLDLAALAHGELWVPINTLGVVGSALILLGLPAMYARTAATAGLMGLVGTVLIALAWMFFGVFLSLFSVLVVPWIARAAPSLLPPLASFPPAFLISFAAALLAQIVGSVLLAIPFIRGRVRPYWVGLILLASAPLTVIGDLLAPTGPSSNFAINLLSNLGAVLLLVGLGALGFRLWAEPAPDQR